MVVSQLSSHPLAPDQVIRGRFRNEVLKSAAEKLALMICSDIIYGFGDKLFVLFNQVDRCKVSLQQVLGDSADSSSAVQSLAFTGWVFKL